jgi:hypothetical protein
LEKYKGVFVKFMGLYIIKIKTRGVYAKRQGLGIYFILEKVWKIIYDNDKDLNTKDLRFTEFQNYFLKEKSVDYVHDTVHRLHGTGSRSLH